jgi:hypothetical protein
MTRRSELLRGPGSGFPVKANFDRVRFGSFCKANLAVASRGAIEASLDWSRSGFASVLQPASALLRFREPKLWSRRTALWKVGSAAASRFFPRLTRSPLPPAPILADLRRFSAGLVA